MMIFAVLMLMSITASAIDFGFAEVAEVKKVDNGFVALTAGGESVAISAWQFQQMSGATGYYILSLGDKKIVAAGDEFLVEPLTIDSVGLSENNKPEVFFNGGSSKIFANEGWLKALKGQIVRRVYINIPTWEFENFATVDKGDVVVYHNKKAPVKNAAPVVQVVKKAPAKKTNEEVVVPAATVTPIAQNAAQGEAFSGIKFSIKH